MIFLFAFWRRYFSNFLPNQCQSVFPNLVAFGAHTYPLGDLMVVSLNFGAYLALIKVKVKLWLRWLRHYATNRKVAGSIPDEVIFKFI
jgi:hypothetical protein